MQFMEGDVRAINQVVSILQSLVPAPYRPSFVLNSRSLSPLFVCCLSWLHGGEWGNVLRGSGRIGGCDHRTSDSCADVKQEGGKFCSDRGKETLFVLGARTRPGCCYLSLHCLLKCWHLGLNDGFQFSQNIPKTQRGKHPPLPALTPFVF